MKGSCGKGREGGGGGWGFGCMEGGCREGRWKWGGLQDSCDGGGVWQAPGDTWLMHGSGGMQKAARHGAVPCPAATAQHVWPNPGLSRISVARARMVVSNRGTRWLGLAPHRAGQPHGTASRKPQARGTHICLHDGRPEGGDLEHGQRGGGGQRLQHGLEVVPPAAHTAVA